MNEHTHKILLAVPSPVIQYFVETHLKRIASLNYTLTICNDLYTFPELLKTELPDIVITSPLVVGDVFLPLVKERCGIPESKFIAICVGAMDEYMLRNFNGKFALTDRESDFAEMIEKMMYEDCSERDELKETALTPREKDIVVCVVKGMTNKEIASELYLSTHTVITHRRNIAKKLQIHSPAGLTIYAIVNNLVELSEIQDI